MGEMSAQKILDAYKEQMEALLAGGVDLFIIETMSSLEELKIAVQAARAVSKLPVVAQLSFSVEGHTLFGATPEDAIRLVVEMGKEAPDVIGINCGAGPGPLFDSLMRMTEAAKKQGISSEKLTFSCLPNAGQPSLTGGRYQFSSRPEYCASYVEPYIHIGAHLVGGCCGTTPEHIKAMRKMLDEYLETHKENAESKKIVTEQTHEPIFISNRATEKSTTTKNQKYRDQYKNIS